MKIMTIVGARPNFMKAAPILAAIDEQNRRAAADLTGGCESPGTMIEHILVHTGQHYDEVMSGAFFNDLNLPKPDIYLGAASGSHATQTAEIMKKFEDVLLAEKPEVLIVVGDVNSTLACSLVAAKISFDKAGTRPLIAHVEAGLRSFDRAMPEEVNRIVTDHLSDLLFVTEKSGVQNLSHEGIPENKIHFVGNTMIDSLLSFRDKADSCSVLEDLGLRVKNGNNGAKNGIARYALLTLHRPSNVDDPESFQNILASLSDLAADCPIIFPVHPRTRKRIEEFGLDMPSGTKIRSNGGNGNHSKNDRKGIILTDPQGYLAFLSLMKNATIVVTDSGGIQEETTCLGVPCVTVRENTERPVTVESGTNIVAGTEKSKIKDAIRRQLARKCASSMPENWDGHAASRIVEILVRTRSATVSSCLPNSCGSVSLEPIEPRR